jgi:glycyl-tRNA synthetase beta chain
MADFLLELLSEEIPARMHARARADLARLFGERLAAVGLAAEAVETYSTPRRLVLIARGLPEATQAISEELKGPRSSAPPQALEGFLRKTGLAREQLEERDGIFFARIDKLGRATREVLSEAVPAIVRNFPWPKSMRWGAASMSTDSIRWVRPLQGIVALLGEEIVEFEVAGVRSGAATVGHRFHHPGIITIGSAGDYVEKLNACHVIVDQEGRARIIRNAAAVAAEAAGVHLVEDEGLVVENAGLTEYPVPLLGRFDPAFLDVPQEVIQLTARVNQKYFVCRDGEGKLANAFVCVANIDSADGGEAIIAGNRKVLAARLADARFFWEQDLKTPLGDQAKKLRGIVFHEKLGTIADKVRRVELLATFIARRGVVPSAVVPREQLLASVSAAARLAKADLVTGSVGEFPELQGTMGGYIARVQGQPAEIAEAVRDHYKPVGQGDEAPRAPVTAIVALADKLDSLAAFYSVGEKPTGSRDPFALRRAALGVLQIVTANAFRLPLRDLLIEAAVLVKLSIAGALGSAKVPDLWESDDQDHEITAEVGSFTYRSRGKVGVRWDSEDTPTIERGRFIEEATDVADELFAFFGERLKVQQREAGVRHDLIDAVFALPGEEDIVRILARVRALQAFVEGPDGADLLTGYRRAANILRKEGFDEGRRETFFSYQPEKDEEALDTALDQVVPLATAALKAEDFEGAMEALSGLREPVDAFFDNVTVNDPDERKRETRLILLSRIRRAVDEVADFSKIEG